MDPQKNWAGIILNYFQVLQNLLENKTEVITLVEWPEKIQNKPGSTIDLRFEYDENLEKRFLTIAGLKENKFNANR